MTSSESLREQVEKRIAECEQTIKNAQNEQDWGLSYDNQIEVQVLREVLTLIDELRDKLVTRTYYFSEDHTWRIDADVLDKFIAGRHG